MPVGLISILNQSSHSGQLMENRKKHSGYIKCQDLESKNACDLFRHTSALDVIRTKLKKVALLFSQ